MNLLKFHAIVTLCLAITSISLGNPTWVEVREKEENPPVINLVNSTNSNVTFSVTIPGFFIVDTTYDDTTYQRIWFPEEEVCSDSGVPEVPIIIQKIAIPICSDVTVTYNKYNPHTFTNYYVFPAPYYPPGMEPPEFVKDYTIYDSGNYFPVNDYNCSSIARFREQRLVEIVVNPLFFSPDSEKVIVYDSIRVELSFTEPLGPVNEDVGIFNAAAELMFLNYEASSSGFNQGSVDAVFYWSENYQEINMCDYLILTAGIVEREEISKEKIEELAQHRVDFNGFYVCLVNIENIEGYNNWINIRTFIRNVYENSHSPISSDGRLPFVLLVGDAWDDSGWDEGTYADTLFPYTEVECQYAGSTWGYFDYGSDHYYADLDNDLGECVEPELEDVALGRLPVGSNGELNNIVDKIIDFETEPAPLDHEHWRDAIAFQMGRLMNTEPAMRPLVDEIEANTFKDFETILQYSYGGGVAPEPDYIDQSCYILQYGSTTEVLDDWLVPMFNGGDSYCLDPDPQGMLIYFYTGHGYATALANSYLRCNPEEEGVYPDITNYRRWPLLYLDTCLAGRFYNNENWYGWTYDCLAEHYTVKDSLGGIAAFAHVNPGVGTAWQYIDDWARIQFGNEALPNTLHEMIGWSHMAHKNIIPWVEAGQVKIRAFSLFGDPALNLFVDPSCENITENTTWSGRKDITCQITVCNNATLTINAGAEVNFAGGASLVISNGSTLDVNGSAENPVVFQGLCGAPWAGIYNLGTTTFDYTNFHGGGSAITLGYWGSSSVDNCTFDNMGDAIVLIEIDNTNISNCTIQNGSGFGIYALACDELTIENNYIKNNAGGGINLHECTLTLIAENNFDSEGIYSNGAEEAAFGGIHLDDCSPKLRYNWIENNEPYQLGCVDGSKPVLYYGCTEPPAAINTLWANDDEEDYPLWVVSSFPEMKYGHNNIINQESQETILIYDATNNASGSRDIRGNYWGTDSPQESQFYPSEVEYDFSDFDDTFNELPGDGPSPYEFREDSAWTLFVSALALEEVGSYVSAINIYKSIAENYHDLSLGTSAIARIKDCAAAGELNLSEIQSYFLWLSNQPYEDEFCHRAYLESISMKIHVEDYYGAIEDYEAILLSGPQLIDSIQIAIDLSMAWLLAGMNPSAGPFNPNSIGQIPSLRSNTLKDHQEKVVELWALLNGENPRHEPKVPMVYELYQNYPNPFNPTTQISYYLPHDSRVSLTIYNILGQKVVSLVDDVQSAGIKRVFWNGKNKAGVDVASGIYFYRLKTVDNTGNLMNYENIKKMVLIK